MRSHRLARLVALAAVTLVFLAQAALANDPGPRPASVPAGAIPANDGSGALLAPGAAATPAGTRPTMLAPPNAPAVTAALAGRRFTYQGMLRGSGVPVNGTCDLEFSLWDDPAAGTRIGATQTVTTSVINGLFTVTLNDADQFGATAFDGRAVWVAISVRQPSGSGSYTALLPRQALTAAPLASGLVPHSTTNAGDTYSGYAAFNVTAPPDAWGNPMAMTVTANNHSNYVGIFNSVGLWADSGPGIGVWATTNTGTAIQASAGNPGGWAGQFFGDVNITGKLNVPRFKTSLVLNSTGGLPLTSGTFSTSGGTLLLSYSGSGYTTVASRMIGMNILLDGNPVDATAIFANNAGMHLAFVAKQWVLTGIAAGNHTISLTALSGTTTDFNDIFNVTVTELPY